MDAMSQGLWIGGHIYTEQELNQEVDDLPCTWPDEGSVELQVTPGIIKNGVPEWLCEDMDQDGAETYVPPELPSSDSAFEPSRSSSPLQVCDVWQGVELYSPLLTAAVVQVFDGSTEEVGWQGAELSCLQPMSLHDEPDQLFTLDPQEASDGLSSLCPQLEFDSELIPEILRNIPMETTLIRPCYVMLDRNEVSRYLAQQSKKKKVKQKEKKRSISNVMESDCHKNKKAKTVEDTDKKQVKKIEVLESKGFTPCIREWVQLQDSDFIIDDECSLTVLDVVAASSQVSSTSQASSRVSSTSQASSQVSSKCQDLTSACKIKSQRSLLKCNNLPLVKKIDTTSQFVPETVTNKSITSTATSKLDTIVSENKSDTTTTSETVCRESKRKKNVFILSTAQRKERKKNSVATVEEIERLSRLKDIAEQQLAELRSKKKKVKTIKSTSKKSMEKEATKKEKTHSTEISFNTSEEINSSMDSNISGRVVIKIMKKDGALTCLAADSKDGEKSGNLSLSKPFDEQEDEDVDIEILTPEKEHILSSVKLERGEIPKIKTEPIPVIKVPKIKTEVIVEVKRESSVQNLYKTEKVCRFVCPNCNKYFTRRETIEKHMKFDHLGMNFDKICPTLVSVFVCTKCPSTSYRLSNLKQHFCLKTKELKENRKEFCCTYCIRTFKSRHRLKHHVFWSHAVHNLKSPPKIENFHCHYCKSKFCENHELQEHIMQNHLQPRVEIKSEICIKSEDQETIKIENKDVKLESDSIPKSSFMSAFEQFVRSQSNVVQAHELCDEDDINVNVTTIKQELIIDEPPASSSEPVLLLYNEHNKMFNNLNREKTNLVAELGNIEMDPQLATYVKHADLLRINRRVLVSEASFPSIDPSHFKCTLCKYKTVNNLHLKDHIKIHVAQDIVNNSCPCGKICQDFSKLKSHIFSTHNSDKDIKNELSLIKSKQTAFRCQICCSIFTDARLFYIHILTQESNEKYYHDCINCNLEFNCENDLVKHSLQIHQDKLPYKCKICFVGHNNLQLLINHITNSHLKSNFHCELCNLDFNIENIQVHLKKCINNKYFKCPLCPRQDKIESCMLSQHFLRKHSNGPARNNYYCHVCMNYFTNFNNYNLHAKQHELVMLRCDFCAMQRGTKKEMKEHICEVHFSAATFEIVCSVCGECFKKRKLFRKHVFHFHMDRISSYKFEPSVS